MRKLGFSILGLIALVSGISFKSPPGSGSFICAGPVTLDSTAVDALTTTAGTTLVSANAGHFYVPQYLAVSKSAGTAYTVNSSAAFGIGHLTVGAYYGIAGAGLMDQSSLTKKFRTIPAITSPDNPALYVGKALGLMTTVGSYSGSGSNVTVSYCYYDTIVP